jgi:CRISPR/Cas system CMR subunit Cmr4 (Cas7 group RAMP superfamily)
MTIRFYAKNVYGNVLFYPVDYAKEIFVLTNCRTLTNKTIHALEQMGFKFQEVLQSSIQNEVTK